ncbi:MAG: hypothetical protein D6722_11125 [Bacteroidetes bacterium]|nr:MAG: hypothetical protein D6722_11125 [Bacteroidota bacterium]
MPNTLHILAHYEGPQLAGQHAEYLQAAGIPCVLESATPTDFYNLDGPIEAGDTFLKVPVEHLATADQLLDTLDATEPDPTGGHTYLFMGALMVFVGILTAFAPPAGSAFALRFVPLGLVILGFALYLRGWLTRRDQQAGL